MYQVFLHHVWQMLMQARCSRSPAYLMQDCGILLQTWAQAGHGHGQACIKDSLNQLCSRQGFRVSTESHAMVPMMDCLIMIKLPCGHRWVLSRSPHDHVRSDAKVAIELYFVRANDDWACFCRNVSEARFGWLALLEFSFPTNEDGSQPASVKVPA